MELHQVQKTVLPNGTILIEDLPFDVGEKVNVTIVKSEQRKAANRYPLRGTPYRYDNPFGSAAPIEDWEVLK